MLRDNGVDVVRYMIPNGIDIVLYVLVCVWRDRGWREEDGTAEETTRSEDDCFGYKG